MSSKDDFRDEMKKFDHLNKFLTNFQPEVTQASPAIVHQSEIPLNPLIQPGEVEPKPTSDPNMTQLDAILASINFLGSEVRGLRLEVAQSNERFATISERIDCLETGHAAVAENVSNIASRVESLESTTLGDDNSASFLRKLDDLEQNALNTKAILTVAEALVCDEPPTSGDRTTLIQNYLARVLRMSVNDLTSMTAYRFDADGKRFVIDFYDRSLRPKVFKKFRELKPQNAYLNDFLTKRRSHILYETRKLRETFPRLKKAFSSYGRIYVVIQNSDGERPKLVQTLAEVKALLRSDEA